VFLKERGANDGHPLPLTRRWLYAC
jgi:hypothetical protein